MLQGDHLSVSRAIRDTAREPCNLYADKKMNPSPCILNPAWCNVHLIGIPILCPFNNN